MGPANDPTHRGSSNGEPGPPDTGRRRLLAVIGAGAVVGLVGGGLVRAAQDDGELEGTAASPPETAAAPPTTERPTEEEILAAMEEVETGFTIGQVVVCDPDADGEGVWFDPVEVTCPPEERRVVDQVAYAAIVENTSDQVIANARVRLRFLTATGDVVTDNPARDTRTIGRFLPGQRIALGGTTRREGAANITRVEAEAIEMIRPGRWWPEAEDAAHGDRRDGELTARDIHVGYGDTGEPVVTFTIESTHEQEVRPLGATVVFRNAAGDIVGGEWSSLDGSVLPRGSMEAEVRVADPMEIPGIDPARTEVSFGHFL